MAIIFFLIYFSSCLCVENDTLLWTKVPDYGYLATASHQHSSHETATHMLNFTAPLSLDFVHVVTILTCITTTFDWGHEVLISRNRELQMEYIFKEVHETRSFLEGKTITTWVTSFNILDCSDPSFCIFGLTIKTMSQCHVALEVERGEEIPYGKKISVHIPELSSTRPKRLFKYTPQSVPQEMHVVTEQRWFLYFSWGYSTHAHMVGSVGELTVALNEDESYSSGDRILVWLDAAPGIYELWFVKDGYSDDMIISTSIQVLLVCFAFICAFGIVFTTLYNYQLIRRRRFLNMVAGSRDSEPEVEMPRATDVELATNTKTLAFNQRKRSSERMDAILSKSPVTLRQKDCVICMEEFCGLDRIRVLPCGHCFHIDCIDPWLMSIRKDCPICHQNLDNARNLYRSMSVSSPQVPQVMAQVSLATLRHILSNESRNSSQSRSLSRSRYYSFEKKLSRDLQMQPYKMVHPIESNGEQHEVIFNINSPRYSQHDIFNRKRTPDGRHTSSATQFSAHPLSPSNLHRALMYSTTSSDINKPEKPPWMQKIVEIDEDVDLDTSDMSMESKVSPLPVNLTFPIYSKESTTCSRVLSSSVCNLHDDSITYSQFCSRSEPQTSTPTTNGSTSLSVRLTGSSPYDLFE